MTGPLPSLGLRRLGLRLAVVAAALAAALLAGCAPLPLQVYQADPGIGTLRHSTCAFNSHVPDGVAIDLAGVAALVRLAKHDGRHFLELRLDVPEGKTVELQSAALAISTTDPPLAFTAQWPSASLVDNPIVNAYSHDPGLQRLQLPATARLVGGELHAGSRPSARHFWFAAYVDIQSAARVWVTLPDIRVNGELVGWPRLGFSRKTLLVVATLNC